MATKTTPQKVSSNESFGATLHILKYSITLLVLTGAVMIGLFVTMNRLKLITLQLQQVQDQLEQVDQKLQQQVSYIQEEQLARQTSQDSEEHSAANLAINPMCGNNILEGTEQCDGQSYSCGAGALCNVVTCSCERNQAQDNGSHAICGPASQKRYTPGQHPLEEDLCANGIVSEYSYSQENDIRAWVCNGSNGTINRCFTP